MRTKKRSRMSPKEAAEEVRQRFLERLRRVRILDPACGSGNFLYLALQGVKDLENVINLQCEALGLAPQAPTHHHSAVAEQNHESQRLVTSDYR